LVSRAAHSRPDPYYLTLFEGLSSALAGCFKRKTQLRTWNRVSFIINKRISSRLPASGGALHFHFLE
jgi:hypothetical protein